MNTTCEEIHDTLYVLDAPHHLPEVQRALAHLSSCQGCRAQLEQIRYFDEDLGDALQQGEPSAMLIERVARIPEDAPVRSRLPRRILWGTGGLAAAAALALFLLLPGMSSERLNSFTASVIASHEEHYHAGGETPDHTMLPVLASNNPAAWHTFERLDEKLTAMGYAMVQCSACPWETYALSHLYYKRGDRLISVFIMPRDVWGSLVGKSVAQVIDRDGLEVRLLPPGPHTFPAAIVGTVANAKFAATLQS